MCSPRKMAIRKREGYTGRDGLSGNKVAYNNEEQCQFMCLDAC